MLLFCLAPPNAPTPSVYNQVLPGSASLLIHNRASSLLNLTQTLLGNAFFHAGPIRRTFPLAYKPRRAPPSAYNQIPPGSASLSIYNRASSDSSSLLNLTQASLGNAFFHVDPTRRTFPLAYKPKRVLSLCN